MKGNISISILEVRNLASAIQNKFEADEKKLLKVNSNPANYEDLEEAIKKKEEAEAEENEEEGEMIEVGSRFLCKFLFESTKTEKEQMRFRRERVDLLYKYVFGKSRIDYLKSNAVLPYKLIYKPSIDLGEKVEKVEVDEFITLANERGLELGPKDFINITDTDNEQFWNQVNAETHRLIICVNQGILEDLGGMTKLRELLLSYISRIAQDPNIVLLISRNLLSDKLNIKKHKGQDTIHTYWDRELKRFEDEFKEELKNGSDFHQKKKNDIQQNRDSTFKILRAIVEIFNLNWVGTKLDKTNVVDDIQPIIAKISETNIEGLLKVVSGLEEGERKDLLCVISYNRYFHETEEEEMQRYFENFYNNLQHKHNIIRVFCVKAKRNSRAEFRSLLSKKENENVRQFMRLGKTVKVFLLLYQESPMTVNNKTLLYEQDYILSVPALEIDYANTKNHQKDINEKVQDDILKKSKIFLSYPEDDRGNNRMFQLDKLNFVAVNKWMSDFILRINTNIVTDNHLCIQYNPKDETQINKYLKLN